MSGVRYVSPSFTPFRLLKTPADPSGHSERLVKDKLIPTLSYIADNCPFKIETFDLKSFDGVSISKIETHRILQSDFVLQSVCKKWASLR